MILESLSAAVGNTPLVRLRSIEPPGVEIHAKLEWFNPGGSVKDRAGLQIIREAVPSLAGRTLIDSTSGNTGIAYAWIGAALGVRVALVMPENVSEARKRIIRAHGAQIVFSDPLEGSDGAIRLARKMVQEEPSRWFYADQYSNSANPRAHELGTAKEIWQQTQGRVTHAVLGIGTGGTVMGTGRGLKARNPRVQIVAVEPAERLCTGSRDSSTCPRASCRASTRNPSWTGKSPSRPTQAGTWPSGSSATRGFSRATAPVRRPRARCASRASCLEARWW